MTRTPDQCPFRARVARRDGDEHADCTLLETITGLKSTELDPVKRDTCESCCRSLPPQAERMNPIVASLVFDATTRVIERRGKRHRDAARADQIRLRALAHLHVISPQRPPSELIAPAELGVRAPANGAAYSSGEARNWAIAMLTLPRTDSTIAQALQSFRSAGLHPHVIAASGAWIPDEFPELPVTTLGPGLGRCAMVHLALTTLCLSAPDAEYYGLFPDNIEIDKTLKEACDHRAWPTTAGILALDRVLSEGALTEGWLPVGHQTSAIPDPAALIFRRDVLHRFLSELQRRLLNGTPRNGTSLGITDWANREGVGIAVHAPPLVRPIAYDELHHTSKNGAACVANDTAAIDAGSPATRAKVGLIGWNTASGLGSMNRDLASHGVIDRWLVPRHPVFPTLSSPTSRCRIESLPREYDVRTLRNWMRGLDWVVFVELPYIDRFAQIAREEGIGVACIPMWELVRPGLDWLRDVDLMLCPNAFAFELFHSWKERYGYGWDVAYVPWAIDAQQFRFRPRSRCERFVFVNGTGGCRAERLNGSYTPYRRKGFELILATARRLPSIPFLVYTQVAPPSAATSNVEIREHQPERDLLYEEGDICVQPSHWEGLGLQLLECQAAGMPLVTTDAPPMNEFRPFLSVPAEYTEIVTMCGNHPITAHHISPDHLAQVLSRIHGADLREASEAARAFVETEHSWDRARQILAAHLRVRSALSGVGR